MPMTGTLGRKNMREEIQGRKEELEKWKGKVIPMIIGALETVIPKLEKWLQQIPGTSKTLNLPDL